VWADGTLNGRRARMSLKTRDWSRAVKKLGRILGDGSKEGGASADPLAGVTLGQAIASYESEMEARHLKPASKKKYKMLFGQLRKFAGAHGIHQVGQFNLDLTEQFRQTWRHYAASTAGAQLNRLRCVFHHFADHAWIPTNWAKKLAMPRQRGTPTLPYSPEQVREILQAIDDYRAVHPRAAKKLRRLHALCLLMRYSGLRIGDATSLASSRLTGERLFLYTAKTGTPVHTKLPAFVVLELARCPVASLEHWFWNGAGTVEAASENYRKQFRKVCKAAAIVKAHPHRFRDTFAVELLLAGVSMENVSMLLGHSSIKVTEKHYAPWLRSRQVALESELDRAMARDTLIQGAAAGHLKPDAGSIQ